jgi:hypothetical protein
MKYLNWLVDGYNQTMAHNGEDITRLEWLSDYVFDYTTYDSGMAELFAGKTVEVCRVIANRVNSDYIKDDENYKWYLLVCNLPFLNRQLNWGTSIRGAWFDHKVEVDCCGLWDGDEQLEKITFTEDEFKDFTKALEAFVSGRCEHCGAGDDAHHSP